MIVFSKNEEEHLAIVLAEFQRQKLFINPKKSEFFMLEIHFLGHSASKNGVCEHSYIKTRFAPKNLETFLGQNILKP